MFIVVWTGANILLIRQSEKVGITRLKWSRAESLILRVIWPELGIIWDYFDSGQTEKLFDSNDQFIKKIPKEFWIQGFNGRYIIYLFLLGVFWPIKVIINLIFFVRKYLR